MTIETLKTHISPDWLLVCISALCMLGSFIAFCLARREQKKAKDFAEITAKYYQSARLSKLDELIREDFKRYEHKMYSFTAEQISEQYAGYSVEDAERVLIGMEKRGILVCETTDQNQKMYFLKNNAYPSLAEVIESGNFSF